MYILRRGCSPDQIAALRGHCDPYCLADGILPQEWRRRHSSAGAVKLSDEFNLTNDVTIELIEFFSRYPVLTVDTRAGRLDRKLRKVLLLYLETKHITGAAISRVPIAAIWMAYSSSSTG